MSELVKIAAWLRSKRAVGLGVLGFVIVVTPWSVRERWLHRPHLVGYELQSDEECTDSVVATQLPAWSGKIPLRAAFQQQRTSKAIRPDDNQKAPRDLSQR